MLQYTKGVVSVVCGSDLLARCFCRLMLEGEGPGDLMDYCDDYGYNIIFIFTSSVMCTLIVHL